MGDPLHYRGYRGGMVIPQAEPSHPQRAVSRRHLRYGSLHHLRNERYVMVFTWMINWNLAVGLKQTGRRGRRPLQNIFQTHLLIKI